MEIVAEILATIHNSAVEQGQIEVTLKTTIGGKSVTQNQTIDVHAHGLYETRFACEFDRPAERYSRPHRFAAGGCRPGADRHRHAERRCRPPVQDTVQQTVPLQPYGMPVFASASGMAASDTTAWVEAPQDMPLTSPMLEILVGPSVEQKSDRHRAGPGAVVPTGNEPHRIRPGNHHQRSVGMPRLTTTFGQQSTSRQSDTPGTRSAYPGRDQCAGRLPE